MQATPVAARPRSAPLETGSASSAGRRIDSRGASRTSDDRKIEVHTIRQPTVGTSTGSREWFQAPGQSGTAGLSIPLTVTQARGLEPELTLSYHSDGGNGVFGEGAQVTMSSLARTTNRRLPKYDDSDTFALDGAELVPIRGTGQARTAGGRHFTIAAYRPRRESAFTRIEYWQPDDGGVGFWRTLSRDDEIAVYGTGPATRIADPDDPMRVFEWLIEARCDPRGNAIRYRYKEEDNTGVAPSAAEQSRRHEANRYPAGISYGNVLPFVLADPLDLPKGPWLFDVLFDYGEYSVRPDNDAPAIPVGPWICRSDSFSNYAAGFERRTHRLCRNVLMVHHFPDQLGANDVLVHVTALGYTENPHASRLVSVGSAGWWYVASRPSGQRYSVKALPPLRITWSELPTALPVFTVQEIAPGTGLPRFGEPPPYALVDLDGSGLPGVLYADGATVSYVAPELSAPDLDASVIYRATPFPDFPIARVGQDGAALVDLDGDGRLSLSLSTPALAGFYPRREDGGWQPFRPFSHALVDRDTQPAQFADLTGDGRVDRLRINTDELAYNVNLGRDGFAPLVRRGRARGLPLTAPPPPGEEVRFADVLGGGTTPAVLIRSGSLRCWPNLGYGRFGVPIDLPAPSFPDNIGPDRVLLADLAGTGYADLIIALTDRVRIHRNLAGNRFDAEATEIMLPSPLRSLAQLRSADMAGMGCHALVFTSDDPAPRHWVCDLAGGRRPGLVTAIDDGRGRVVRLAYTSSARYQLLDRLEGHPWITTLVAPVNVVARVEHVDEVAGVTRVTDYRYSHGYFDPIEREFRGFGLLEMREQDAPNPSAAQSIGDGTRLLKREWYHTGAVLSGETLEEAFAREYWQGDARAFPMPPSCFDWQSETSDAETWRDAVGALAGTLLRRELFAADDPAVPISVEAGNALVRLEQPRAAGHAAVFLVTSREHVTGVYDGVADDPRIEHEVTLEVDAWGDVALACNVSYARRPDRPDTISEQKRIWITASRHETMPVRQGPDLWLAGLPWQDRRWTLPHPPTPVVRGLYYDFQTLLTAVTSAIAPGGGATLLERSRLIYAGEGCEAPPAAVAPQALVLRDEVAAFDADELAGQFSGVEPPGGLAVFLVAQGYRLDDGLWWNPGLTQVHAGADGFFLPVATRDPFAMRGDGRPGTVTTSAYDAHHLMITSTTAVSTGADVLPAVTTALSIDYRTLKVTSLRDANQRIVEILLDPLGDVMVTSERGWEWRDGAPVPAGFAPLPLNDPAEWPWPSDIAALIADPSRYLGGAASFHLTDWSSWQRRREPVASIAVTAQVFPDDAAKTPPRIAVTFTDGFGRRLQSKVRTESGVAFAADGKVNEAADERWTTTGGRHYNGLGLPDREYEPYFTDHWSYTANPDLNRLGATLILHYDALGRPIRTDYPKGDMAAAFHTRIVRAPWRNAHWDQDDTIKASDYYRRYIDPGGGGTLPPLERDALIKAAVFDGTPRIDHLDPRGLTVRLEELLTSRDAAVTSLASVYAYDADGLEIAAADPRQAVAGRFNLRRDYALGGQVVRTVSADAGTNWSLTDVMANAAYSHDSRGTSVILDHDGRHRPILTRVFPGDGETPIVAERSIYGDSLDATGAPPVTMPERRNLMGEACVMFDGAGRRDVIAKTLAGGVSEVTQRLALDARVIPDWQAGPAASWTALFAALDPRLDSERFAITSRFDAVGHLLERVDPGGTTTAWRYRRDGLLAQLTAAGPRAATHAYLAATDYNAKDQRLWAVFGNVPGGLLRTEYRYDPDDFRLTGIATTRQSDGLRLQDLTYWADPMGNVTAVTDAAAPAARTFHGNQDVTPDQGFTYDSLYRLTVNDGRAHVAYSLATAADGGYGPYFPQPVRRDAAALERYGMTYDYDDAGNLWRTRYSAASTKWTQTLAIASDSNRGGVTGGGLDGMFDAAGNQLMLQAAPSPTLAWSWANRLAAVVVVQRDGAEPDAQYHGYDAAGLRVRKQTRRLALGTVITDETITLGDHTIHRRLRDGAVVEEWRSTRLMDDDRCIAELVDWTVGTPPDGVGAHQIRYQLDNLIHSSVMEVAGDGRIISYEEFAPFGATVYAAGASLAEVSLKSFRYAGRERDEATGLYYYGARYYAPWLCRWLSPDPAGDVDGLNLYAFVRGNPVSHTDIGGLCGTKKNKNKSPPAKNNSPPAKKVKLTNPASTSQSSNVSSSVITSPSSKVSSSVITSQSSSVSSSVSNANLSVKDIGKRTGFSTEQKKRAVKGKHQAHKLSYDRIKEKAVGLANNEISVSNFQFLTNTVAKGQPIMVQAINDYANLPIKDLGAAKQFTKTFNSAQHNLGAGDPSKNMQLKENFDPGARDSIKRSTKTTRARSPSPHSKDIISAQMTIGDEVSFYAPDGTTIVHSRDDLEITTTDMIESLTAHLSIPINSKQVGNRFIIYK